MTADLLDGTRVARDMRSELAAQVAALADRGVRPGLGVLLAGDDPASRSYVSAKEKACQEIGILSRETRLSASASRDEILAVVEEYNRAEDIDGILVQLPLPDPAMETGVLYAVDPDKDVDGFHPLNVGRMIVGLPCYLPCTAHGIIRLLVRSGISLPGRHVVIVGRSQIVGRPLANLLTRKDPSGDATVTLCHSRTVDLARHTRAADILVVAAGRPGLVTADMIRPGAVVIDVGVNRVADAGRPKGYRLVGDVDFEAARAVASAITPVPGGVGPMTITMLLYNTIEAARRRRGMSR